MTARPLACAALVVAICAPRAGLADTGRRTVAVLEFRSGSGAVPEIGERFAASLARAARLEVVGPTQARQKFGATLDAELTECAGEVGCVARLGAVIGAADVLLVGVSELGDVILTLQRIDVAAATVEARLAEALVTGAEPSAKAIEGFLRRVFPAADFERWGRIRVQTNVSGARVAVDEESVGETPLDPIRVRAPADYDLRVSHPGYADFRARIAVAAESEVVVSPELTRIARDSWYTRWWVLAIAGTVVAGAAVGTAVLATRGDDSVLVMIEPF